ncbi:uncharacterized protein B0H18DRAFT_1003937 [Fomitopsis serialis]|uniref:uncharacterized protein n=1 Tax=Fomitopsis serialis TaxID=139415 RepID=UPI0020086358|nr:uncharacterized protein B0H18DRAFT_1003937 [Neoantrodia serialis]KAH9927296.1 hypothetical protein B0H18DRAFT_1003937 [Neoantrodia serialis]
MLVDLKIHQFHNENDILKRFFRIYSDHPDFALRLRHRIAGLLLAANTPAYLNGFLTYILEHVNKHLEELGLPTFCKDDPAYWQIVKTIAAHEIAQLRSAFRGRLDLSIKNNTDIYGLAAQVMMYDMKAKKEHWGRLAFLRHCAVTWETLPTSKINEQGKKVKVKRPSFWAYVDSELKNIRIASAANNADEETRKENQASFFKAILNADLKTYTTSSGEYARVYRPGDLLTRNQRLGEDIAAAFDVDDTGAPPKAMEEVAEPGEDE